MQRAIRRVHALAPLAWLVQSRGKSMQCESSSTSYYGSYSGDRFGGGIGQRVGVDESRALPLFGTGVTRVALFSETHENLRNWATEENWKKATEVHKKAYFTRTENLAQEAMQQRVRSHYTSVQSYVAKAPIKAALFRLDNKEEFTQRCSICKLKSLPSLVSGKFDEKSEPCIVDFANKRLGGGWLGYGMVQEEIMFTERPDYGALCARSLLEMPDPVAEPLASPFSMHQDEAWILSGAPAFAHVPWYGRSPPDAADRVELLQPAEDCDTCPTIVAIDAIKSDFASYQREHLDMMLVKAYTGFVAASSDPDVGGHKRLSTGSWGCGAFYNNERVMFVIQTLAANLAGVHLDYHVLGDGYRLAPAFAILENALVKKLSVSQVLDELTELCASDPAWKSKYKPRQSKL